MLDIATKATPTKVILNSTVPPSRNQAKKLQKISLDLDRVWVFHDYYAREVKYST